MEFELLNFYLYNQNNHKLDKVSLYVNSNME